MTEDVLLWLKERHDNCVRIAGQKTGSDRAGWLEDAGYFQEAINLIQGRCAVRLEVGFAR